MNINLEYYKTFEAVVKKGNITKAAEELLISQPAVTKIIKNLEASLGGELFVRTRKGMTLTSEGKEFYKYITKGLEYFSNAENKFTDLINLDAGILKIGTTSTICKEFLMDYIQKFSQLYPKVNIEVNTNSSKNLLQSLKEGFIDLVFINIDDNKYEIEYNVEYCSKITNVFVANEEYSELKNKKVKVSDLKKYNFIFQKEGSSQRRLLDEYFKKTNLIIKPKFEFVNYTLVNEAVKKGLGVAVATKEYILKDINEGKLFIINTEEELPSRQIGMVTLRTNELTFSAKKFKKMIENDINNNFGIAE